MEVTSMTFTLSPEYNEHGAFRPWIN